MFAARNMMFASAAFSPLSLSPALWLDASDAGTLYDATTGGSLVAADGAIARWNDKSGNARHVTQSTSGARPLRKTAIQNGLGVVRFDGSDDRLSLSSGLNLLRNVPGATLFCVHNWLTAPTVNKSPLFISTATATTGRAAIGTGVSSRKPYSGGRRLDANSFQSATAASNNPDQAFLQVAVFDYAAATVTQYINGSVDGVNLTFQTAGNSSDTNSAAVNIGVSDPVTPTVFANVDISEILVFPTALSAADRQAVDSYLRRKWALY